MNTQTNVPKYTLGNARWIVVVVVLLGLFLVSQATIKPALAYSCGSLSSGHCYAIAEDANYIMIGAKTNMYVAPLSCGLCFGNAIINDMWYGDAYGNYWVETGYWSQTDGSIGQTQRYFWGEVRNCPKCVNMHDFGDATGDVHHTAVFQIVREANNNISWDVSVYSPAGHWYGATAANNSLMSDGDVTMGQELSGSCCASAANARFSYRFWLDTNRNWQTIDGNYTVNPPSNPPYLGYVAGDPGHDFYTHCC